MSAEVSDHMSEQDIESSKFEGTVKVEEEEGEEEEILDTSKWYNRGLKIGSYQCLPYSHGKIQILMVSFVCFMTVGMYSALGGLGGGGQLDPDVVNNSNVALYSTFAAMAFFSGSICNKLGVTTLLTLGGWGYSLYTASLLSYNIDNNGTFVIVSGAILGISAAFLWTAQGTIMMSYAEEEDKGKWIAIFWAIFQMGNLIGSFIPLIQTVNSTGNSVGNGTYAAFLVLISLGSLMAMTLLPSRLCRSTKGKKIVVKEHPTWVSEFKEMYRLLKVEPWIMLLFPFFWASNWFGAYESNDVNLAKFNIRTRALNNLLMCSMEVFGAVATGFGLDMRFYSRRTTARVAGLVLMVLTMVIWGGGWQLQKGYTRESVSQSDFVKMDWSDKGYIGPMILYMCYGGFDAIWQTYAYWLMGSLTNSTRKLALYTGFYKGIQSAGAAVMWRMDNMDVSYENMLLSVWIILAGSLLLAAPVIYLKVCEQTDEEADKEFTTE